jgi:thiosulfate/3-mercaptopyruvate sulfurtransferase
MSDIVIEAPSSPLVTVNWLKDHLASARIVVLDASIARRVDDKGGSHFEPGHALFRQGHIPGSQFADLFDAFSDPSAKFPFTRPKLAQLEKAARSVGIGKDSIVVVYDSLGGAWAARLWWVLRANGLDQAYVLNGGLSAWTAAGLAIEQGEGTMITPGDFTARPRDGFFLDTDDVSMLLDNGLDGTSLVCGVRTTQFTGEGSDDPRAGHIPGSISLPYSALLNGAGLIDADLTSALYEAAGLEKFSRPVLYCGGGVNAAGLALAFSAIGHPQMSVYDGSLNEWKANPNLPLVRGEG